MERERRAAELAIRSATQVQEGPTAEAIRAAIERVGGLLPLLEIADPKLRAQFYDEIGLRLVYHHEAHAVDVEAHVLNGRVGGAFPTLNIRICLRR